MAHLGAQSPVPDTVQRNDCDTFPKASLINEILTNLRVLDNDIVQPPTCGNLKGGCLVVVRRFQSDQGSDESLDFRAIKTGVRRVVVETQRWDPLLLTLPLLVR